MIATKKQKINELIKLRRTAFRELFETKSSHFWFPDLVLFLDSKYSVERCGIRYYIRKYKEETNIMIANGSVTAHLNEVVRVEQVLSDQELPRELRKIILFNLSQFK